MLRFVLTAICLFSCSLAFAVDTASLPIPKAPTVAAKSYLLIDFDSGQILAEKDVDAQVEPASITKMMTAYVVFRNLPQAHCS